MSQKRRQIEEVIMMLHEAAVHLKAVFGQNSHTGLLLPWKDGQGVLGRKSRIKKRKS